MSTINLHELFKQYQDEELFVLPEGEYVLEVLRCTVRNDNALMPTYKVVGGPYNGKTVMVGQFTLTDKAASIFFRNLKGFGIDKDTVLQCSGLQDLATLLTGRVVEMQVKVREWNGEDRNEMKGIGTVKLKSVSSGPAGVPPPAPAPAPAPEATASESSPPPPPPPPPAATGEAAPF